MQTYSAKSCEVLQIKNTYKCKYNRQSADMPYATMLYLENPGFICILNICEVNDIHTVTWFKLNS